jgi:catechol 2,3-dioxygenase-like lactoylglutathione lyase family enzyme
MTTSPTLAHSVQIGTVEVPVADLKRAIAWYQSALGLTCTWSDEHHALLTGATEPRHAANSSFTDILLVQTEDASRLGFQNTNNGLRHGVLDFRSTDLEGLHAHLLLHGAPVDDLNPPVNQWAPRGFGFFDSEGNRLGAFTYAARRNEAAPEVSS